MIASIRSADKEEPHKGEKCYESAQSAQPKSVTSIGCAAILACYVLQWVARRAVPAAKAENAGDNTPLDRVRVILTLAAAAVWIVTIGMSFFWKV